MMGRLKRKDLSTLVVIAVVNAYGPRAWDVLIRVYPPNVVMAAYRRDMQRCYLECGSEARPWVTPKGLELMQSEKYRTFGF